MDANQIRKNHRYHFLDEDFVVSADEHDYIVDSLSKGKTQVILRDGNLIMNLSLGFSAVETDHLTDEQENKRDEVLKLEGKKCVEPSDEEAENRRRILNSYRTSDNGFSQVGSKGDMKKCEGCEEEHFIPADRTLCLPCLIKKTRESTAEKK